MKNNFDTEKKIVIVGAGITGLTSAYILANHGYDCLLIEKNNRVGGMCRSFLIDGIKFDLGPHLLFPNLDREADRFLYSLLDKKVVKGHLRYAVYVKGKYWPQPIRPWSPVFFPWEFKKDLLRSWKGRGEETNYPENSLAKSLTKKVGHLYYQTVFEPLLQKKTKSSGYNLHRDWLTRPNREINQEKERPPDLNPIKALFTFIRLVLFPRYIYPLGGFEVLPRTLYQKYSQLGGETICNATSIDLQIRDKKIEKISVDQKTVETKELIWTAPIDELFFKLKLDPPDLPSLPVLIAFLTFERPEAKIPAYDYIYYPQKDVLFNRIYFPPNLLTDSSTPDHYGVCLEISDSGDISNFDKSTLLNRILGDLEKIGLFAREKLRQYHFVDLPDCMPIYSLDYEQKLNKAYQEINCFDNLQAVGRQGGKYFCQTTGAADQGIKVAQRIIHQTRYQGQ